jgi:hypothetical protein
MTPFLSYALLAAAGLGIAGTLWHGRRLGRTWIGSSRLGWIIVDLALVFLAFDNVPRLLTGTTPAPVVLALLGAFRLVTVLLLDLPALANPAPARWVTAQAALAGWVALTPKLFPASPPLPHPWIVFGLHGGLATILFLWSRLREKSTPNDGTELIRIGLLGWVALLLARPWMTPYLTGTGDAKLYAETTQDFLNQIHAGVWPPLVSQSEVAPFGAVFPFRLATYHYYLCAGIDWVTRGALSVYGVEHVAVGLSLLGGALAMYGVLRRLLPAHPWVGCTVAALYVLSPAWLGPLFAMTMFFTTMALPYLPLALAGAQAEFGAGSVNRSLLHGGALAAVWHAHPPVGFWTFAMAGFGQVAGLAFGRQAWRRLPLQALAWGVCAILCSGLWY